MATLPDSTSFCQLNYYKLITIKLRLRARKSEVIFNKFASESFLSKKESKNAETLLFRLPLLLDRKTLDIYCTQQVVT